MNYNKIKEVANAKKISIASLCQQIGMTENGFYQAIKNDSFKVRTMEEIAAALGVSPSLFLDDSDATIPPLQVQQTAGVNTGSMRQSVRVGSLDDCRRELEKAQLEVEYLKREVAGKEELIAMLKERK